MFCVGMTVASVKSAFATKPLKMPQWAISTGVVGCLALVVLLFDGVYNTLPVLILGVAFALVVFDATLFGLLVTKPAKRLGDISYGIYLLQGPVLFLVFAPPSNSVACGKSAWVHWAVVMAAVLVLIMLATTTHVLIERPGIQAGQWVLARIAFSASSKRRIDGLGIQCRSKPGYPDIGSSTTVGCEGMDHAPYLERPASSFRPNREVFTATEIGVDLPLSEVYRNLGLPAET